LDEDKSGTVRDTAIAVMLAQLDNLDNFAIYDVISLERDDTETGFSFSTVTIITSILFR